MITVLVNKIIPMSIVDGPGNRTSIFLQGCNISCAYCHNPETQRICNSCGICVSQCPSRSLTLVDGHVKWDGEECIMCDNCIKVCQNFASPRVRNMSAKEVFQQVEKNIPFIRGITVSGGECMLHPEFLQELFAIAVRNGLRCLIDSNGMMDFSQYPELMQLCEGIMLDVKSWDKQVYKKLTKANNSMVKRNLCYLIHCNKLEELRIVCLQGEVDAEAVIVGIAGTIGAKVANIKLKLIKFRNYGVKVRLKNTSSPDDEYMQRLLQLCRELGFQNAVII